MPAPLSPHWLPTKIRRVEAVLPSGAEAVRVVTDAGPAIAKFLGNEEAAHFLACEFIGTSLAATLGLPVFDAAVVHYDGSPAITLHSGEQAKVGSMWLTRREEGSEWSGREEDLHRLANRSDLAKLVLLDQWTLNCDRYRPGLPPAPPRVSWRNVFFSRENDDPRGLFRLVAMDHTHCFTCGRRLTAALSRIDNVQDPLAYGLFPEFISVIQRPDALAAVVALHGVPDATIRGIVDAVPTDWQVDGVTREALQQLIMRRRDWLIQTFLHQLFPQDELSL